MVLLITGLLLFCGVHLIGRIFPDYRKQLKGRLGDGGYKGIYSLLSIGGIVLIVFGWRASEFQPVYFPTDEMRIIGFTLMIPAVILLLTAQVQSNLKRMIRHPQLSGVIVWSVAHLLMNGDVRSIILFAGFSLWGIVSILLINYRKGIWQKPHPVTWMIELRNFVAASLLFLTLFYLHPYIAGVAIAV